jgi:ElaB/YqjD/DUF883 family membrane-anchored ribosome-binding protein
MPPDLSEVTASVEDALREVARIKSMVTEAVEDGVKTAVKAIKQGRYAAEDMVGEARHTVKQNPLQAMGIVFAAGVLTGAVVAWIGTRRS